MKRIVCLLATLPVCVVGPAHATAAVVQEVSPTIGELIADGRSQLAAHRPELALPLFERASELDGGSVRARIWILRAWMDQGRSNDTLDAIDALQSAGESGPELDYLYGMAFTRRAQAQIAQGVADASIEMNLLDAVDRLARASDASPERFSDAFLALAKAGWYTKNLELARTAVDRAVGFHGDDPRAWLQLGRIAMSQFRVEHTAKEWGAPAEAHWRTAEQAFDRAVTLFGAPIENSTDQTLLADAALQLGHARMWKKRREDAANAYAVAIAWSPDAIDYGLIRSLLSPPAVAPADATESERTDGLFNRALEEGAQRFERNFGGDELRDATLLWWLGWTRFDLERPVEAEQAFLRALEKSPQFVNAWFYVAMARYDAGDTGGAIDALEAGWEADPAVLVDEMQGELDANVEKLERLTQECRDKEQLNRCAFLAELCAESEPLEKRHWNNLGLFLRYEADALVEAAKAAGRSAPDPELLADLHERSFRGYERALQLAPDDAAIVNDAAVLLHYYLERDWERALEMYTKARELASRTLEDDALSEEDRTFFEAVVKDAQANYEDLQGRIAALERLEESRKKLAQDPPL